MAIFSRKKTEIEPDTTIDLRETAPAAAPPQWGSPVPCPSCEGRGYLDHIDPFREIMYLHCIECLLEVRGLQGGHRLPERLTRSGSFDP